MRRLSRIVLYIECLLLVYPTLFGYLFSLGATLQILNGLTLSDKVAGFITGTLLFATLTASWRVMFWVIFGGLQRGVPISRYWFLFCYLGAGLTALAWLFLWLEGMEVIPPLAPNTLELFAYGLFFIVPFFHVVAECYWQRRLDAQQNAAAGE